MSEIGKLYVVKTKRGNCWLFERKKGSRVTCCSRALCLNDMTCWPSSTYICDDSQIEWIKHASHNHIVIWNRILNDNVSLV